MITNLFIQEMMIKNSKPLKYSNLLHFQAQRDYSLREAYEQSVDLLENTVKCSNEEEDMQNLSPALYEEKHPKTKISRILMQAEFSKSLGSFSFPRRKNSINQTQQKCYSSSKSPSKEDILQNNSGSRIKNKIKTEICDYFRPQKFVIRPKRKSFTFGIQQINGQTKQKIVGKQKMNMLVIKKNIEKMNLLDSSSGFRGSFYSHKSKTLVKNLKQKQKNPEENGKKDSQKNQLQFFKDEEYDFGPNVRSINPMLSLKQKSEKMKIVKKRILAKKKDEQSACEFQRSKTNEINRQDLILCGWNSKYEDDSTLLRGDTNYFF